MRHSTEESRFLPYTCFVRNRSNKDGFARLCKECVEFSSFGDKRKRRKIVIIPEFDIKTHKWCNRCETVRSRQEFFNDKSTIDGLNANCKHCKAEQKRNKKMKSVQVK